MIIYTKLAMIVLGLSLFKNIWQKDSTYIHVGFWWQWIL